MYGVSKFASGVAVDVWGSRVVFGVGLIASGALNLAITGASGPNAFAGERNTPNTEPMGGRLRSRGGLRGPEEGPRRIRRGSCVGWSEGGQTEGGRTEGPRGVKGVRGVVPRRMLREWCCQEV
eukprot:483210-Prorocentrum_minimum.AAC.6